MIIYICTTEIFKPRSNDSLILTFEFLFAGREFFMAIVKSKNRYKMWVLKMSNVQETFIHGNFISH